MALTTEQERANRRRANDGHAAMVAGSPDYPSGDADTDAVDAIANILHARCNSLGDADRLVRTARDHFTAEHLGLD